MATEQRAARAMRVYALDPRTLSQEQIAVTFAMTSRSPEAFDAIAKVVSEAKAADFNEKWVVGYGHASVAEHAVLHMAVEDLSRLAADEMEDNRLASYTEKSSRYQVLDRGSYHVPAELRGHRLERQYIETCDYLFDVYHDLLERTQAWLRSQNPQGANEKDGAYRLRIRRIATDHCRFVLPASTLTNVGMTLNARSLEHAITKLLSHELAECRDLGERHLLARGRRDEHVAKHPHVVSVFGRIAHAYGESLPSFERPGHDALTNGGLDDLLDGGDTEPVPCSGFAIHPHVQILRTDQRFRIHVGSARYCAHHVGHAPRSLIQHG